MESDDVENEKLLNNNKYLARKSCLRKNVFKEFNLKILKTFLGVEFIFNFNFLDPIYENLSFFQPETFSLLQI